jgi:hypothetical protein
MPVGACCLASHADRQAASIMRATAQHTIERDQARFVLIEQGRAVLAALSDNGDR